MESDVEDYTVGEELHSIMLGEKIYIPHMLGDEPIGMIICGNGGDRSSSFEYFKNLVHFPYMKKHDNTAGFLGGY